MTDGRLVIQDQNPELVKGLKKRHRGGYPIEIAKRGVRNKLFYSIGNFDYETILWQRDNELNSGGSEFIGSSTFTGL